MSKIAQTPVVIPVDPELREALDGLTPDQLEEVRGAGRRAFLAKVAELRPQHQSWCNVAEHERQRDVEGCFSVDVVVLQSWPEEGTGAWLSEYEGEVSLVLDLPGAMDSLSLSAARALGRFLMRAEATREQLATMGRALVQLAERGEQS